MTQLELAFIKFMWAWPFEGLETPIGHKNIWNLHMALCKKADMLGLKWRPVDE